MEDNLTWLDFVDITDESSARRSPLSWQKVMIILLALILACSLIWLGWIYVSYKQGESLYANANTQYVFAAEDDGSGEEKAKSVDLDALTLVNPDIKGWIYIEDTPISYPILWSGNDNTYLRHTFEGKYDIMGSIILSQFNTPDFLDQNNLIFGHNSHGSTMFGTLKDYADADYFSAHPYVYVVLPGRTLRYQVFSAFETDSNSNVYSYQFKTEEAFKDWKRTMVSSSLVPVDEKLYNNITNTITLSTCSKNNGSERRFVVIAQLDDVTTEWK